VSKIKIGEALLHGQVAPGFEQVQAEFRRNFAERDELGAACTAYHKGQKVVDLWGGYRDRETLAPWEKDTLVLVFSSTKGFAAMAAVVAHSRGWLDYEEKVATYWPEFAQQGKANITVRQLLSHQAGLSAIDQLGIRTLSDLDTRAVADALAFARPAWEPGARQGYHCWSIGWYTGELVRRVDPQHRSLGQFFREEIAEPLGLELYIGLPSDVPDARIATIKGVNHPLQLALHLNEIPWPFFKAFLNPQSLTWRSMVDPKMLVKHDNFNTRTLRSLEMPAGNGIGQVRSMARAYSAFATGDSALKLKPETLEALTQPARAPAAGFYDEVLRLNVAFSVGFLKSSPVYSFGSSHKAFGSPGAGGSFCFADPDAQVSFAYAMNRMGYTALDDPREKALRDALYRCLGRMR
jgi:CubicO group peptidase (beta-lactamase class C family)